MMKNRYVLFLCFALCATLTSFAQTFTVDGLNYTVTSTSPNEVTLTGGTAPTSDLVIPDMVNDGINDFTVVAVGNTAFESVGLTSVVIPNTIRNIGNDAFTGNQLTTIFIPNGVETIGIRAFRLNQIGGDLVLPNSVTNLGNAAFEANNISNLTIPESLSVIPNQVFRNNDLSSVTIPASITSIGIRSFRTNPLTQVIAEGLTPASLFSGSNDSFFGSRPNIDLTVPTNTVEDYTTAGWIGFATVNGEVPLEIGNTFDVDGLSYRITALNPTEVEAVGGTTIPANLVLPETVIIQGTVFTLVALGNTAFESAGLTSVSFPNTLRSLGQLTFRFNSLTTVTIPDGITDIPQRCFSSNDLTSVTLPNSIETIGFRSFENNPLTTITFPENVASIASSAFSNNPLNTITSLNTTPPSIQGDTFSNRQNTDLTVPDTTENAYATAGWVGFNSVNGMVNFEVGDTFTENNFNYTVTSVAPNEVTVTGGNAVPQNLNINETVSNGGSDFAVTAVGSSAFISNGLTSVSLPNTITTIEGQAFRNNQLTSITIPENVSLVASRAFQGNPLFAVTALGSTPANITTDVNNDSFGNRGGIDLTIPTGTQLDYLNSGWTGFATVNGEVPLEIGNTFDVDGLSYRITALNPTEVEAAGGTSIPANLVLPETITFQGTVFTVVGVGDGAFASTGLTSVTFPTTTRAIGSSAFRFNALTSVVIPEGVTDLPNRCFASNDLTSVTFPTSLETIGFRAFESNDLTSLILPENLVSIGQLAFGGSINSINSLNPTPPSVVLGTGDDSFTNENDIDLTVPNGTEAAYEAAGWVGFNSLNGVINFEVGDTFTVNNLNYTVTSVAPNEVTLTGGTAVPQDLVIDAMVSSSSSDFAVTAIGSSAFDASNLTSVILPSTLVSIGPNGFRGNDLTSVILPNSLVSIGGQGFRSNNLTSITFPETISSIDFRAFEGNPLSEVITLGSIPASITTGDNDTFSNRSSIDLLIPEGTTQAYLDGGWTGFNSINSIVIGTEFEVDGLSYRITSLTPNEVVVTGGVNIPNDLVIPEAVSFGGENYTLVGADFRSFDAEGLDSVILPNTLRNIGDFAFENNGMPSVEIPEGVEIISFRSFRGNTLTTITIPSTVTSIAQDAFANNPLQTVTALGTIPAAIETLTFGDRSGIDLFIPEGTLPAYINAGWIGFASVTEITIDITVAPKVFLQGASLNPIAGEEDLMRDSLRENGLLPTISPYGDGATVNPTVFTTTGANAIVDWVLVELRTGADNENTTVVNSRSAFLQRDGDVVDLDGSSNITFTEEDGDYFIAIIHRNHIGILAAVPAPLSNQATALDFTQDVTSAKGENLALTTLVNGTFAMIAGDADGSSQILNTDITEGLTLAGGGEGYSNADADMNGFVLNSDIQLLILGNSGTVQQFD